MFRVLASENGSKCCGASKTFNATFTRVVPVNHTENCDCVFCPASSFCAFCDYFSGIFGNRFWTVVGLTFSVPNSDSAQVDGGEDEVDDVYTQLMEDVEREPEHSGEPAADPMSPGQVNGASSTTKTSRKAKEGRTTDSPAAFDSSDEDKKLPKRLTKGVGKKSKPKERPTKEHQSEESPRRRETASFSSVLDVFSESFCRILCLN